MTPENFCYWLQGYFELQDKEELSLEQIKMIKEHLQLVFTKVTSSTPNCINDKIIDNITVAPRPSGGYNDYVYDYSTCECNWEFPFGFGLTSEGLPDNSIICSRCNKLRVISVSC